MSEDCECPKCPDGLPEWLATFADLMSLLMCFFVLLLSFATMDAKKYKQVAGSMKAAFGIQLDVEAMSIPKGTSVIAKNYSPGKPTEITVLEIMRENSTDTTKANLDFSDSDQKTDSSEDGSQTGAANAEAIAAAHAQQQAKEEAEELKQELASAIGDGLLEVESFSDRVLIRIRENGSFSSGRAKIKKDFEPVLKLIADVLNNRDGHFVISGHTDDIPIETKQFRSNWDLSAARASSVVLNFIQKGNVDPERMEIRAFSDNEPLVPNDSRANRAKNRRVEISVLHGNRYAIDLESPSDSVDFIDEPQFGQ